MYHLDVNDEWDAIHQEDLWIYNKLQLSRILGYNCGPVGTKVPKSDFYIIRPCINFLGMGRFARIEWIEDTTDHLYPSDFWCEIFHGEHLSVDFHFQEAKLVVRGIKNEDDPLYKWQKWEKIDRKIGFPPILSRLKGNYDWINCEFINGNLIEVHIRQNPDFRYENEVAIPVWNDQEVKNIENFTFIQDEDYRRRGFFIK